jgi:hypothetical protein
MNALEWGIWGWLSLLSYGVLITVVVLLVAYLFGLLVLICGLTGFSHVSELLLRFTRGRKWPSRNMQRQAPEHPHREALH